MQVINILISIPAFKPDSFLKDQHAELVYINYIMQAQHVFIQIQQIFNPFYEKLAQFLDNLV